MSTDKHTLKLNFKKFLINSAAILVMLVIPIRAKKR